MTKILYIKSFTGTDHDAVLADYQTFYNSIVGTAVGDPRTEFMVTSRTLHESPILTVILRVYEK